jgi:hypothetical protein
VRNIVRHVRGLFGGTTDYGVEYVEVGNEPDLVNGAGNLTYAFWTGTRRQWIDMYGAIAAEIDADPDIRDLVRLGGGSFAFQPSEPDPPMFEELLTHVAVNGTRLDFVSYHFYSDDPAEHFAALSELDAVLVDLGLSPEIVNAEWGRALDDEDPVYGQIEHGLFRTKVLAVMQKFGVGHAHEAVFRDLFPSAGMLGLIRTGPVGPKPVSDTYLALNKLNPTLDAVQATLPPDHFGMAARDAAGTRMTLVFVGDDPGADAVTEVALDVANLPWGAATFRANRYEVSEATFRNGEGVALVDSRVGLSGASYSDTVRFGPGPGAGRLILWELIRTP